jgi:hypothetical protein
VYDAVDPDSEAAREFLKTALTGGNDSMARTGLEMAHTLGCMLPVGVPTALSESADLEVRIKFYKALPLLTLVDGDIVSVLRRGLTDAHWAVRAMAARACGHFRAAALVDELYGMCLQFVHPAEASHAARALAKLGGEARSRLHKLAAGGFGGGHHIAAEVLQQGAVRPAEGYS